MVQQVEREKGELEFEALGAHKWRACCCSVLRQQVQGRFSDGLRVAAEDARLEVAAVAEVVKLRFT